ARQAERLARQSAYDLGMLLTQAAWEQHQVDRFRQLLGEHRPRKVGDEDLRGFEWYYWKRQFQRGHVSLQGHAGRVTSVCFSPDGRRLASASGEPGKPGEVKVWEAQTGQEALTLKGHTAYVISVCFSPDGKRLASASGGFDQKTGRSWGEVRVWDAQTGQLA